MILFKDDFNHNSGIIDTSTKNYSFLRMVRVLQKMGVQNRYFFLYLLQPELQGIDPHNLGDADETIKMKIIYEIKMNPWYYFRQVIRIPSAGGDPVRYILNRGNLAFNWLFLNSINQFITMPRQTGKSQSASALISWLLYFAYRNSTIGLFCKDSDLVQENVGNIKAIRNGLPPWMLNLTPQDTDNKQGLSYDALKTHIKSFIAKPEIIAAKKQGRGERLAVQFWDEMAFYKNNHLSYPSATSAADAAQTQVRNMGLPAANILATTAGRLAQPSGAYAYSIKQGCLRFNEKFYDYENNNKFRQFVDTSASHMVYLQFSYKQLGFDEKWLQDKIVNKTPQQIDMDYLNQWLQGTGSSVVPTDLLNKITQSLIDPIRITTHGSLIVHWYVDKQVLNDPMNKRKNYLIGMDTSDNVGNDYTTMVVTDPTDLTIIATCKCNQANFVHIVNCVMELMQMLPNSIIIPERNKNGAVLVDILIQMMKKNGINPFYRIYNTWIQDFCEKTPSLNTIDLNDGSNRKHFGFNTSSSADSRDTLYGRVLILMLNHMATRLFDRDLADEIRALTVRNGRVDHPAGCHDDLCIAWLLTGFFAFFGKNHYMYGIPQGDMLKGVSAVGKQIDPTAKERQIFIQKRIGQLQGLVASCTNQMIKTSYERELRRLKVEVDNTILQGDVTNVDQISNNHYTPTEKKRYMSLQTIFY